jgi:hypothetical protein
MPKRASTKYRKITPVNWPFALIVLAFGLQMTGEVARAKQTILEALKYADRHVRTYH